MIRFFGIIFFLFFSTFILGQDEILSPLETNLSGGYKKLLKRSKTIDSLIVYTTDTLKIPIFDVKWLFFLSQCYYQISQFDDVKFF